MVHHSVQQHVQSLKQKLAFQATASTTWPFPLCRLILKWIGSVGLGATKQLSTPRHLPEVAASFIPRARILHVTRFICTVFGLGLLSLNQALGGNDDDWPQPRKRYDSYLNIQSGSECCIGTPGSVVCPLSGL